MTEIKSISLPDDLGVFLQDNPEISLSKIVQARLYEIQSQENTAKERIKAYEIKLNRAMERLQKAFTFIEKEGLANKAIAEGVNV
jgi:hypothetical protein